MSRFVILCMQDGTYLLDKEKDDDDEVWSNSLFNRKKEVQAKIFPSYKKAHRALREVDPECILDLTVRWLKEIA